MHKFTIKNRKKRKYTKKISEDTGLFIAIPLLAGFLPAMIIAFGFLLLPFLTFSPFRFSFLPQAISYGASHLLVSLPTMIHLPTLPQMSLPLPTSVLDGSVFTLLFRELFDNAVHLLLIVSFLPNLLVQFITNTVRTRMEDVVPGMSWIIVIQTLWYGVTGSTSTILYTPITFRVVTDSIGQTSIVTVESILRSFTLLINTLFTGFGIADAALIQIATASMINIVQWLLQTTIVVANFALVILMTGIHLIAESINFILFSLKFFLTGCSRLMQTFFAGIAAIVTLFTHIVTWPFIKLAGYYNQAKPSLIYASKLVSSSLAQCNRNFATTVSLVEKLLSYSMKKA